MDTSDVTVEILKSIRDEIHETNGPLDEANGRLGALERRQVESEVRLATETARLVGVVREVRDAIYDDRVSRVVVDDHERRITTLERRRGT